LWFETGLSGDHVSARAQPHAPALRTGVTRHFGHLIWLTVSKDKRLP